MRISQVASPNRATACLVLADGASWLGEGFGETGIATGEVCFNTAMTGYQEILTDPSYAGQIITFTFPHIGNVGVNDDDDENATAIAAGAGRAAIVRTLPTAPSNHRARQDLASWMRRRGIVGIAGIDTRALTARIRETGMPLGLVAHDPAGQFDMEALRARARRLPSLEGQDLVPLVTQDRPYLCDEGEWSARGFAPAPANGPRVVVIDCGVKKSILRRLVVAGFAVTVVPPTTQADEILAMRPAGVVLSNGPGDPAATGVYAVPVIKDLLAARVPVLGICLGHQMLALAIGARTLKMPQGHHGANHPVKETATGRVAIVSMNHGFAVDEASLPARAEPTFTSLFDGSNAGLRLRDAPAFSVQHHPEAGPGPHDSFGVFTQFRAMVDAHAARP